MRPGEHRAVKPRYGRIAALATSVSITVLAALGGAGVFVESAASPSAARDAAYDTSAKISPDQSTSRAPSTSSSSSSSTGGAPSDDPSTDSTAPVKHSPGLQSATPHGGTALPANSGTGKRVVFSQHLQRVWLVSSADHVKRTYLVSGSKTRNLFPGTYPVYSRSRNAIGIDDSGTMEYFVRFTQGPTGAAIGFHSIPTKDGHPVETAAQLGTTQSHGCIRQWLPDAMALWNFAPSGTSVVVVA